MIFRFRYPFARYITLKRIFFVKTGFLLLKTKLDKSESEM